MEQISTTMLLHSFGLGRLLGSLLVSHASPFVFAPGFNLRLEAWNSTRADDQIEQWPRVHHGTPVVFHLVEFPGLGGVGY